MLFKNLMAKGYMINRKDPEDGQGGGGGAPGGDDDAGAGDDDDTGDKGGKDGGDGGDKEKDGDGDGDGDDDKAGKLTEAEKALQKEKEDKAKLLKESMTRKDKIKELEAQLKKFEGVDLDQVQKLLKEAEDAETAKLEQKGQWEKLKEQMLTKHTEEVETLKARIEELESTASGKDGVIEKLTVGHAFDSSSFIQDEMTLTPSKARVVYGSHFDIIDGKVVAFDKPRGSDGRTQLIDGSGEALDFNQALKQIVDADPDRDTLIRSKVKPGSDSKGKTPAGAKPNTKETLHGKDRIAAGLKAQAKG